MAGPTSFTVVLTFAVGLTWLLAIGWLVFVHRQRQWRRPVRWLAGLAGALVIMVIGGVVIGQTLFGPGAPTPAATPLPAPIEYAASPAAPATPATP